MDATFLILAGITGYLIGSISFARLVMGIRAPGLDVMNIKHGLEGSSE